MKTHMSPEKEEGLITVRTEKAGDDRHTTRPKAVPRKPVLQAKQDQTPVGYRYHFYPETEQNSNVRRKNVGKGAWPEYDPTLERKGHSDDEYYAARLRTVGKAKEQYTGRCTTDEGSLIVSSRGKEFEGSPAPSPSSDEDEVGLAHRLADLAAALPPSASLYTSTPSRPDKEVMYARTARNKDDAQQKHTEIVFDDSRSNPSPSRASSPTSSIGSSYSWRSTRAVLGRTREPDADRRAPPPSAWAAYEKDVEGGIKPETQLISSHNKDASDVNLGLAQRLAGRFKRLDVSCEDEFVLKQGVKGIGEYDDVGQQKIGKSKSRRSRGFGV
jgi:hypothetical protein